MTWSSCGISKRSSMAAACSITGRSDAEPTRMPTTGPERGWSANSPLRGALCDVASVLHPLEGDQPARLVGPFAGILQTRAESTHGEHPSPCCDHSTVPGRRPGVIDEDI